MFFKVRKSQNLFPFSCCKLLRWEKRRPLREHSNRSNRRFLLMQVSVNQVALLSTWYLVRRQCEMYLEYVFFFSSENNGIILYLGRVTKHSCMVSMILFLFFCLFIKEGIPCKKAVCSVPALSFLICTNLYPR